jgi:hypothetical protein
LTVNLASSVVSEARVPASVTIPAGTNRVDFEVASVNDGVSDGNRTVTITATAPGFTTGTTQLVVSDADRPDLVVSRIQIPAESVTGGQVAVAFRVENRGVVASTNPIVQRAYLSSDNVLGNDRVALAAQQAVRKHVEHGFEVAVAGEANVAAGEVVLLEFMEVGDVAVVRHRDADGEVDPERLHVADFVLADRRVAHMANRHRAGQPRQVLVFEHFAHEAEPLLSPELLVEAHDARSVLAAVLDRQETGQDVLENV